MINHICPDCNHDESEHMVFENRIYRCVGSGKCSCDKTSKEVLFSIVENQGKILSEAKKVLEPFAGKLEEWMISGFNDDYVFKVGTSLQEFKSVIEFLKKLEDTA